MKKILLLLISHLTVAAAGYSLGIYALPILIAPPSPSPAELQAVAARAVYSGEFRRDLQDSDFFHWGEGKIHLSDRAIALQGKLAPGPAYKLYLSPAFVETEAEFLRLKPAMIRVASIDTFDNFLVTLPTGIDPAGYNTLIVWCESYAQFITAARYR